MPDDVRQELKEEFPRFLNRGAAGADLPAVMKTPALPKERLLRLLADARDSKHMALAQFIAPGLAAIALFGLVAAAILSPSARQPVPEPVPAKNPNVLAEQMADAFALVSVFEARVAYAPALAEHLQEKAEAKETGGADTETVAPTSTWEMSNSIGLLVLRNLPEKATLLTGAQAGPGAWAIPTDRTDQLMTVLGDGFDKPVVADVEMVSRSGLSLGTLRLQLLKPEAAQAMAAASAAAEQAAVAEAERAAKASARKKKRRRLARQRNPASNYAGDAYSAQRATAQAQQATVPPPQDDKNKGLFGTLFGWLGGQGNGQGGNQNDGDDPVIDDGGPTASALGFQ